MKAEINAWQDLNQYLEIFQDLTTAFFKDLDRRDAAVIHPKLDEIPLSENGSDLSVCIDKLKADIIPQLSASRGSRFWAFVTGGATPVATLGDWLVGTFDQNVHKGGDSIASDVERQAISWLCELFELPNDFSGTMTTGGTACNFLGANLARQFAGQQQGIDVAKEGVYGLDVAIFSTTPHASMVKSLGMAGLGQRHVTAVKSVDDNEAMDVSDLEQHLQNSNAKAKVVIASAGTVTGTDFDDLEAVGSLCKKYNAWLHVDGAFGLFERVVNGPNGLTKGIEQADSITVDCHKWLNVPYECGVFLTRHMGLLEQCFDVSARYLANDSDQVDFMSLGVENSRRFRALPVWLSLMAYGKTGIRTWVQSNIDLSKSLAKWIEQSPNYELVYPCQMNVILFRPNCQDLSQDLADEKTKNLLANINKDGRLFFSPGFWRGNEVIRIALSNWQSEQSDIEIAQQVLKDYAS